MQRTIKSDQDCRHCGNRLVAKGASILDVPRKDIDKVGPCRAFEIVVGGRFTVFARCRSCGKRSTLTKAAVVSKMTPWTHKCGCGCGYTVNAYRKVEVLRYRRTRSELQGVETDGSTSS